MFLERCTCEECRPVMNYQMRVCEYCRNKRCPHAKSHRHDCTDSNEPNQIGSAVALDGKCPDCGQVDNPMCDRTPSMTQQAIDKDSVLLATMKLKGLDKIYSEDYRKCVERIEARNRILERLKRKRHRHPLSNISP